MFDKVCVVYLLFSHLDHVLLQALYVNPSDCYNLHWPVVRGQLNVHSGSGGSLTAVLADLETLWSYVIQKHLEIPLKELKVKLSFQLFMLFFFAFFSH